jgi:hypothetical protein
VENQLESQLRSQLWNQVENQLESQLRNQLWGQLENQLGSQLESQLENQLWSQLESQLWGQLENQLESQLEGQLWGQVERQLRNQLESQLWGQLWGQLWSQLENQVRRQLRNQLRNQVENQLGSQLWGQLWGQLGSQLENQLGSQLGSQLWGQLWSQLGSQLENQVRRQLRNQLRNQVENQVESQLENQVESQLENQVRRQLRNQLGSQLENYFGGQQWIAWKIYYDYCYKIGVEYTKENKELLELWLEEAKSCHWWFPYDGIVLISERPTKLLVNDRGQLHCNNGPALEYSDGYSLYSLNGVQCKAKHVETPAEQYPLEDILKEQNVDLRRELIRRVGMELMLQKLPHKVLSKDSVGEHDYELLSIDMPGFGEDWRYLKMLNPSIKVWHLEGVAPTCATVQQAINWRAANLIDSKEDWVPVQLT